MQTLGIRELKAHLSAHLKRVRAGARLTITDRGRPIATVSPVEAPRNVDWALRMVAEGLATWNGGKPDSTWTAVKLKGKGKTAAEMVIEDRR